MSALLHLGFEHPSTLWIAVASLLAFFAGLAINLYRTHRSATTSEAAADSESR
ncbi:hypothetical protein [Halobellus rufus]|uniref:hypothetical protein n=1 Tax=Halobellus rufus TaxID=1448860 RepID=UPI0018CD781F|nr:hypothetical protein [Halobellus rufus]